MFGRPGVANNIVFLKGEQITNRAIEVRFAPFNAGNRPAQKVTLSRSFPGLTSSVYVISKARLDQLPRSRTPLEKLTKRKNECNSAARGRIAVNYFLTDNVKNFLHNRAIFVDRRLFLTIENRENYRFCSSFLK